MVARLPRADEADEREPLPLVILRPGQTLLAQGQPGHGVNVLETGLVRSWIVTAEGRSLTLDISGPGDGVGEPAGVRAPCTVTALRPTRARFVSNDVVMAALAVRSARISALATELAWLDVAARIERRLGDLAARFGRPVAGGVLVPFRLTQDDLAGLAGTSRESANRAVRKLVGKGRLRVERRGRYVVTRPLRLLNPRPPGGGSSCTTGSSGHGP
jgi:CRP/FNR family transcriptional regulator, cyclic AMP receptor protein